MIVNQNIKRVDKREETPYTESGKGLILLQKSKTRDMILVALFTALMVVGAYISIPLGTVPFTLQPLFAMLAGMVLGARNGTLATALYLLMGLMGLPVFANGFGGPAIVFKPTFGYLLGFIVASFLIGIIRDKTKRPKMILLAPFVGLAAIYLIGVPYLMMVFNTFVYPDMPIDFVTALSYGFFPFIAFDLVKAALAGFIGISILPILRNMI